MISTAVTVPAGDNAIAHLVAAGAPPQRQRGRGAGHQEAEADGAGEHRSRGQRPGRLDGVVHGVEVAEHAQPFRPEGQREQDAGQQRERQLHPGDHGGEAADLLQVQAERRRRGRAGRGEQREQDQQHGEPAPVRVESEDGRDRHHHHAGHGEHHHVAQHRAEQQREPAGGGHPQPFDHAGVELPDHRPARAHPGPERDQHQDPWHEHVEHLAGREGGAAGQRAEQRREQRQVQQRGDEPGDQPDRLAERLEQLAAEEQLCLQRERHAATSAVSGVAASSPVSRSDRPV
jgi:hypothetical protein